ncbi:hypothetical protein FH972_025725 [Carpinus fangiana]|uniref:Apple domain-containing protein n=1 Tax=Carpinus fangiana TaxID=176857 RepID=A0A5N6L1U8_9ROSI|nr:hypothetical protein FH972_025725 [Carpinus fangiana]
MRTTNAVSFGGAQNVLYDNNYPFKAKCFNVPIPPPSQAEVSSLASNGGAFCTSFIKYIPWASTTNLKTTISTVSTSFKAAAAITVFPKTSTFLTTKFVAPTGYTGPPVKRSAQPAATLLRRQAVPTPTQITAWPPQKISAACSQIATGYTVVTAYTSTLTSYTSTTVKTVRATVTAPTPVTTQIVTSTGCASQPTGAVVNPYFAPVQIYSPQVPSPWSISGVTSYSNCQYNFNDAFCSYINFQRYGYNTMMSMLLSGTYDSGRISQPLTNLVAGRAYNLTVVTAYSSPSQINCIVTYELDGVPFKSFLPTFPSSNSPSATYELATFYPTAASHALAVNIYCPTYNKGEGNRALIAIAGIDAQGPICPYFISKPAASGCPAGVTQGPTAVDGSGAIFDIKCGTNYGGTIMASTSDMDLLGSDTDNDCLAWCTTWGGACAAVAYDTRSSNCILYSDNTAATSKDASFVYAARVQ